MPTTPSNKTVAASNSELTRTSIPARHSQVLWLGSNDPSTQWLMRQFTIGGFTVEVPHAQAESDSAELPTADCSFGAQGFAVRSFAEQSLDEFSRDLAYASELGIQRIVISLTSRVEVGPVLARLAAVKCEIPIAIALGQWFDGSRRTGHGETPWLQLAWHRYWDGWQRWLCHSETNLLTHPVAPAAPLLGRPTDGSARMETNGGSVAIVSDSSESYRVWQRAFAAFGFNATRWSSQRLGELCQSERALDSGDSPTCVLLTDHVDLSSNAAEHNISPGITARTIDDLQRQTKVPVIYSCAMPRANQWLELQTNSNIYTVCSLSTTTGLSAILHDISAGRA